MDVELIAGTHPCSLEAATGDAVRPIGRRRVHFLDEAAEHLAIDFTVTNVTKIIIAADALVERGYVATFSREDSYLEHPQRGRITLHRFGRTFWMKLRRVTTQGNLVVAGVARAIREGPDESDPTASSSAPAAPPAAQPVLPRVAAVDEQMAEEAATALRQGEPPHGACRRRLLEDHPGGLGCTKSWHTGDAGP